MAWSSPPPIQGFHGRQRTYELERPPNCIWQWRSGYEDGGQRAFLLASLNNVPEPAHQKIHTTRVS
jgi:hypothetical protein